MSHPKKEIRALFIIVFNLINIILILDDTLNLFCLFFACIPVYLLLFLKLKDSRKIHVGMNFYFYSTVLVILAFLLNYIFAPSIEISIYTFKFQFLLFWILFILNICLSVYFSLNKEERYSSLFFLSIAIFSLLYRLYPYTSGTPRNFLIFLFILAAILIWFIEYPNFINLIVPILDQNNSFILLSKFKLDPFVKESIFKSVTDKELMVKILKEKLIEMDSDLAHEIFEKIDIDEIKQTIKNYNSDELNALLKNKNISFNLLSAIVLKNDTEKNIIKSALEKLICHERKNDFNVFEISNASNFLSNLGSFISSAIKNYKNREILQCSRLIANLNILHSDKVKISSFINTAALSDFLQTEKIFNSEFCYIIGLFHEQFPNKDAVEFLKTCWLHFNDKIIDKENKHLLDFPSEVSAAILLRALANCISSDSSYTNYKHDEELQNELQTFYDKRKEIVSEMKSYFYKQEQIIDNSPQNYSRPYEDIRIPKGQTFETVNNHLKKLSYQIEKIDTQINKLIHDLSPVNFLSQVINNHIVYSNYLRQNAMIGLKIIFEKSFLDTASKDQISDIIEAFYNPVKESEEFNFFDFLQNLQNEQSTIFEIRLFKNCFLGEIVQSIKLGLKGLCEKEMNNFYDITLIVKELNDLIPDYKFFLQKYPLQLMDLDSKRNAIGYFTTYGFKLERWVEYIPPQFVGEVKRRFYKIIDYTSPNSMGLYYKLFYDKFSVIPIIYHEYQHYLGISNEMNVWLRENLFLRHLIAINSPNNDNELLEYHMKIIRNFELVNDYGSFILLLFYPRSNDFCTILYTLIYNLYDNSDSEEKVQNAVNEYINNTDTYTHQLNFTETWHPEIRYPYLTIEASFEREEIKRIMKKRRTQKNFISEIEFQNILNEPSNIQWIQEWDNYLEKIKKHIPTHDNHPKEIAQHDMVEYFINRI